MKTSGSYTISTIYDGDQLFIKWGTSSSNTVIPTTFTDIEPDPAANIYVWRKEGHGLTEEAATWGLAVCMTGNSGDPGDPGADGDFGVATLSFTGSTISLQGNGQDSGYIIYNDTKFYLAGSYTCAVGGDGVILADISQNTILPLFKKLVIIDDVLSFADFNTGTYNAITKSQVDNSWQYLLIGEFTCSTNGILLNAAMKPIRTAAIFLSDSFTALLKANGTTKELMDQWAVAMGVSQYYNVLATSTMFVNSLFAEKITLSTGGYIKSSSFDSGDGTGFKLDASGDFVARSATITGATHIIGSATIDLTDDPTDDTNTLLKTQYGSIGTGSIVAPSKTKWLGSEAYAAVTDFEEGTGSYSDGIRTYYNFKKLLSTSYFSLLSTSSCDFTWTVLTSGTYLLSARYVDEYDYSIQSKVTLNGVTLCDSFGSNTFFHGEIDLVAGDVLYMRGASASAPPGSTAISLSIKKGEGIFLFNKTTSSLITTTNFYFLPIEGIYINALILDSFYYSYLNKTMASIDPWYNGLTDGETRPCIDTSSITIDGLPYVVKYVTREGSTFKLITTEGDSKVFNGPSTNDISPIYGWYNITGTIYFAGETRGLVIGPLIPVDATTDIGDSLNYFDNAFIKVITADTIKGKTYAT